MSEILVIVPPEWTPQSYDNMASLVGYTWGQWQELQGRSTVDLNEALERLNWFTDEKRVIDVLVINDQLFFKLG